MVKLENLPSIGLLDLREFTSKRGYITKYRGELIPKKYLVES